MTQRRSFIYDADHRDYHAKQIMMRFRKSAGIIVSAAVMSLIFAADVSAADLETGVAAAKRGDFPTAIRNWAPLTEAGNADAQTSLGALFARGEGVEQNYQEAAKLFRRAADQGHAAAQFNLAQLLRDGRGVEQDYAKAAKWYRRAADQGHASAQFNLSVAYGRGRGVTKSYETALKWFRLAAERGLPAHYISWGGPIGLGAASQRTMRLPRNHLAAPPVGVTPGHKTFSGRCIGAVKESQRIMLRRWQCSGWRPSLGNPPRVSI